MKKRILIALSIIVVGLIIQFITYSTIASEKLTQSAIKNLIVNNNFGSDSVIFSSKISIRSSKQEIKQYNLAFSKKENVSLLKKKLYPYTILDDQEYAKYCERASQDVEAKMGKEEAAIFASGLYRNKSRLYITAIEEQKFIVAVSTNWSNNNQFQYDEDTYVWLLFFWMTI
jgi:hypothetical protein